MSAMQVYGAASKPAERDEALRLQEISTLLIQERNVDSLYLRILDAAVDLMASDMASLQVFHPERNALQLIAWKGFYPQSAAFWEWIRPDSGASCAVALLAGCRIIVPDIEARRTRWRNRAQNLIFSVVEAKVTVSALARKPSDRPPHCDGPDSVLFAYAGLAERARRQRATT